MKTPKADTAVMIATVAIVLITDNLAYGVVTGIVMSSLSFVGKISTIEIQKTKSENTITYACYGQLFFASTTHFIEEFDFDIKDEIVVIDVTHLKFWDESAVDAFDKVAYKYSINDIEVRIIGLSESCEKLLSKVSTQYSILPEYVD